jgi:DNA-binding NtrC family response regulator
LLQTRLLNVLEHQVVERPGQAQALPVDARLICGTTRDLKAMMETGQFRQDLYYRLSAVSLSVPPLRDRREDIVLLAKHFLGRRAAEGRPRPSRISPYAIEALLGYHWPGNVRELEHVIERAATMTAGDEIELKDILLPREAAACDLHSAAMPDRLPGLTETIAGIERSLIDSALRRAAGNQARAAQFLGIPRTTLRDKMAKYGMAGQTGKQSPS